jgi:alpha-1,3-fucosyltransferase 10
MIMAGADGIEEAAPERPAYEPLILIYTPYFRRKADLAAIVGDAPGRWTLDRRRISEADAVVFHAQDWSMGRDARKYPGQLWVVWSMESVVNVPAISDLRLMRHIDVTMTYERSADIWTPYLPGAGWWREVQRTEIPAKTENAPLVLFQSSAVNRSGREGFLAELAKHIRIDSYGRFMRNRSVLGPDLGTRTKLDTIARYRFCLALENSVATDYVTEKMFQPLGAGTVPIYLGAPNATEFVPPDSYVDAAAYGTPAKLAEYLKDLLNRPYAYSAYLEWRRKPLPPSFLERLREVEVSPFRRLMTLVRRHVETRREAPGPVKPTMPFGRSLFVRTRIRRLRKTGSIY